MEYKQLGITDTMVSKICLGTMTRGMQNTEHDAHKQLDYAIEKGVNFIDTAEIYPIPPKASKCGFTEQYIGNWLSKRNDRDTLVIATKVAGAGFAGIRDGEGFTRQGIRKAIEGSLRRLQTEYVDLYQLHWPQRPAPLRGKMNRTESMQEPGVDHTSLIAMCIETMNDLQKEGKIRHYGLSNETVWGSMTFVKIAADLGLSGPQSIQNAYSLLRREYESGLAEVSMEENVGLLAYSPLAGGVLSGKYQEGAMPAGSRFVTRGQHRMGYYMNEKTFAAVDAFSAIAKEIGISMTQLALAWVNDRSFVTSNIIGATSMRQLEECLSSAAIVLDDDVRKKIDELFSQYQNPACW